MRSTGKPLTGTIIGAFVGLFVALVIQQAGIWPFDRMLAFGAMALVAIIGFLLTRGFAGGAAARTIAMLLVLGMAGMAALGATEANQSGYLDGGCTASASSEVDAIPGPEATSKSDPFDLLPDGTLSWEGTTPGPITDHSWVIWVDVAGFEYQAATGGSPNDGKSQAESGVVVLESYANDIAGILGSSEIGGVYAVGGWIDGTGGYCEGMGFVRFPSGFLQGPIAMAALALAVVLLLVLLVIARSLRRVVATTPAVEGEEPGDDSFRE